VVGHDMGSFVAYAYAVRYPNVVGGLMLVDARPQGTTILNHKLRAWHIRVHSARDVAEMLVTAASAPTSPVRGGAHL